MFGLVSLFHVLLSLFSIYFLKYFFPIACDVEYLLGSYGWWWPCGGFRGCYGLLRAYLVEEFGNCCSKLCETCGLKSVVKIYIFGVSVS